MEVYTMKKCLLLSLIVISTPQLNAVFGPNFLSLSSMAKELGSNALNATTTFAKEVGSQAAAATTSFAIITREAGSQAAAATTSFVKENVLASSIGAGVITLAGFTYWMTRPKAVQPVVIDEEAPAVIDQRVAVVAPVEEQAPLVAATPIVVKKQGPKVAPKPKSVKARAQEPEAQALAESLVFRTPTAEQRAGMEAAAQAHQQSAAPATDQRAARAIRMRFAALVANGSMTRAQADAEIAKVLGN